MRTLLALAILAAAAQAGQVCHTTSYPAATTDWAHTFVLPKHDPAVGALQSVTVTLRCTLAGQVGAENPAPVPAVYTSRLAVRGSLLRPDASTALQVEPEVDSTLSLGAFDGIIDFAGSSGALLSSLQSALETHVVLTGPADLALFTATSAGESIGLGVNASGTSSATGPGALVVSFATSAALDVSVCYGFREVCQTASLPASAPNWAQAVTFAKHDPNVGPLQSVRLRTRATASVTLSYENLDAASPSQGSSTAMFTTTVRRPDATPALSATSTSAIVDRLGAFDGVLDFAGTSGSTHAATGLPSSGQVVLTSPADLALFTASSPGEVIALSVLASAEVSGSWTGNGAGASSAASSAELDVCYDYAAPPAPFCFGDGSGAACPCGNASAVGAQEGCLNSLGLGGRLRGTGAPVIGLDTLVLTASNVPAGAPVLFFQGTLPASAPFGDGLRCNAGTNRRLGTRAASGGVATFPPAGQTVSGAGLATFGSTLHYQAWYRNAAAFCTTSTFNLTNGLSVRW